MSVDLEYDSRQYLLFTGSLGLFRNVPGATISFWTVPESFTATTAYPIRCCTGASTIVARVGVGALNTGVFRANSRRLDGDASTETIDSDVVSSGVLHHIALVAAFTGGYLALFVDGVRYSVSVAGWTANSSNTDSLAEGGIGVGPNVSTSNCYDGSIEDLRIWRRALSDAEVRQIYQARGKDGGQSAYLWMPMQSAPPGACVFLRDRIGGTVIATSYGASSVLPVYSTRLVKNYSRDHDLQQRLGLVIGSDCTISAGLSISGTLTAGVGLSATEVSSVAWPVSASSGVGLSSTEASSVVWPVSASSGVGLSSTEASSVAWPVSASSGVGLSATEASSVAWPVSASSGVGLSATEASSIAWPVSASSGVGLSSTEASSVVWLAQAAGRAVVEGETNAEIVTTIAPWSTGLSASVNTSSLVSSSETRTVASVGACTSAGRITPTTSYSVGLATTVSANGILRPSLVLTSSSTPKATAFCSVGPSVVWTSHAVGLAYIPSELSGTIDVAWTAWSCSMTGVALVPTAKSVHVQLFIYPPQVVLDLLPPTMIVEVL